MALKAFNKGTKGFTLIELCVVLVIVAIITSIATIAFYRADAQRTKVVMTQFTRIVAAMSQQAVLRQATLGLYVNANGYQAYQVQMMKGKIVKRALSQGELSMPDAFAGRWQVMMLQGPFVKKEDGIKKQDDADPILLTYSDGSLSPVMFTFGKVDQAPLYHIRINASGVPTIKPLVTK